MELLGGLWDYAIPFLIVLTILVFVHELGHYWVARHFGVKVEAFSFGFGPELFGLTDRSGTRWKFSAVPLGGYVKMFGDSSAASTPGSHLEEMSAEDRALSFHHKPVGQRTLIVAAGPAANFLFSIVVLAGLFTVYGQPYTPPVVAEVRDGSAAAVAGFEPGDVIRSIDGTPVDRFEAVQRIVQLSAGVSLAIEVERDGRLETLVATPARADRTDRFGNSHSVGLLGITGEGAVAYQRHGPLAAITHAASETWSLTVGTLTALGQMLSGTRGTEDLGGPLRIAQMSGEVAQSGVVALIWFMAILSINLGLINLFPIPLLDGGHLLFYVIEALRGRPLGERAQEYGFRLGLALVLTLMLFATWNDLVQLRVVEFFTGFVS